MRANGLHYPRKMVRQIDDERGHDKPRKKTVSDDRRLDPVDSGFGIVLAHRGESRAFAHKRCNVIVIGMRVFLLMREQHLWLEPPQRANHRDAFKICHKNMPVRETKILSNIEVKYFRRILSLV